MISIYILNVIYVMINGKNNSSFLLIKYNERYPILTHKEGRIYVSLDIIVSSI